MSDTTAVVEILQELAESIRSMARAERVAAAKNPRHPDAPAMLQLAVLHDRWADTLDVCAQGLRQKWTAVKVGGEAPPVCVKEVPPSPVVTDEMVERAARVVACRVGEDFGGIGPFTQQVLMDTQRAALTAALTPRDDARPIPVQRTAEQVAQGSNKPEWVVLHCPGWPGGIDFPTKEAALDHLRKNTITNKTSLSYWVRQAERINWSPEQTRAMLEEPSHE